MEAIGCEPGAGGTCIVCNLLMGKMSSSMQPQWDIKLLTE